PASGEPHFDPLGASVGAGSSFPVVGVGTGVVRASTGLSGAFFGVFRSARTSLVGGGADVGAETGVEAGGGVVGGGATVVVGGAASGAGSSTGSTDQATTTPDINPTAPKARPPSNLSAAVDDRRLRCRPRATGESAACARSPQPVTRR